MAEYFLKSEVGSSYLPKLGGDMKSDHLNSGNKSGLFEDRIFKGLASAMVPTI